MSLTRSRFTHLLLSVVALCLSTAPVAAAQMPTARQLNSKVDEYMHAAVRHDQFSGSILIAKAGVPIVSRGYGMANYELRVPSTPKSVFLIGSLSKQFAAMAILQLRDRGRLNLTDSVCKYFDRCPAAWQPVTIHHLLTHTSGIVNFSSLPEWDDSISMRRYDRTDFVDVFRDRPLLFAPGETFKYSNSGYYLLALIVERVSGDTYHEFMRRNIFAPLGLASTQVEDTRSLVPNRATGYYWAGNGFVNALQQNVLLSLGSGGILSTTEDLLRWDQALYTDRLLSPASRKEMFTPFRNDYAYGWEIRQTLGRATTTHSGSQYGFSSYIMRFTSERVTIIVLSNSDRTGATKVANDLAAITFGAPYKLPEAQLFDIIGSTIATSGVDAAIRQYRELKRTQAAKYDFGEDLLNELGYDLLTVRKVDDAIRIFGLNVEMFPQAGNTYDSLAEAHMLRGDSALAIRNYERSLELDPKNANAVDKLKRLRRGR